MDKIRLWPFHKKETETGKGGGTDQPKPSSQSPDTAPKAPPTRPSPPSATPPTAGGTTTSQRVLGVAAAATKGDKKPNQDAFALSMIGSRQVLCIADGVGSAKDAHLASKLAVDEFPAVFREIIGEDAISFDNFANVWSRVAEKLKKLYDSTSQLYPPGIPCLQTTLLVVIEDGDQYWVGTLGNGSVLLVRGDFFRFPGHVWPWCITDLSVSHQMIDALGDLRLAGYLSGAGQVGMPRLCCLRKDRIDGEFLIVTTDGVHSIDQIEALRDNSGRIAQLVNPHLKALLTQYLRPTISGNSSEGVLRAEVQGALEQFLAANHFDDDATVGVLISPQAVSLYR